MGEVVEQNSNLGSDIRTYYCNVIYCTSPLTGFYRYKDIFQVYPIPKQFDLSNEKVNHFPILLEYWTVDSEKQKITDETFEGLEDFMSSSTAQNNKLHLLIRLLSVFTNYRFFSYKAELSWFVSTEDDVVKNIREYSSDWGLNLYTTKNLSERLRITKFSDTEVDEVKYESFGQYFTRPHFDERHTAITFNNWTDSLFDAYYQLSLDSRNAFDASATLIYNAQELRLRMKSLSFVSFISSIETLSAFVFKDRVKEIAFECKSCKTIKASPYKCGTCGNPIWGISQQFKEFLRMFLSSDKKYNPIYNKIYGIRSAIVHSGNLLLGDSFIDWGTEEKQTDEWRTLITLMQYSKMSVNKWLLKDFLNGNGES